MDGARTAPGRLDVSAEIFPYDPNHQTFLNVYEARPRPSGGPRPRRVARPVHRHAAGPRGRCSRPSRRRASITSRSVPITSFSSSACCSLEDRFGACWRSSTAFTLGHSVTLALATLQIVEPPSRIIEPAIALSIVYVGADNLLVGSAAATSAPGSRSSSGWFTASDSPACCARPVCRRGRSGSRCSRSTSASRSVRLRSSSPWRRRCEPFAATMRCSRRASRPPGSVVRAAGGAFWFVERVW